MREETKETSADSVLSNRHLWNAFWRASRVLIQREADEAALNDQNIFDVLMIDTEEVTKFEGTCVPLDCAVCRAKIPKPLMGKKTGFIYSFVGSPDMHTSFSVVSPYEFPIKAKVKGTSQKYAYLEGDYMYFSKCLPCVKIVGVFDEFTEQADGQCSIMDRAVNIPDYLIEGSIRVAKENLGVFLQKQQDHVANKDTKS